MLQAPHNLRMTFGPEIQEVSKQAAELVRELGRDIKNMKWNVKSSLIKTLHNSTEKLQRSTELHAYILTSTLESKPLFTVSKLSRALSLSSEKNSNMKAKNNGGGGEDIQCYHEMMMKGHIRRMYSWPSIEVDDLEGDCGTSSEILPRMRALESTAALSLTNFSSTMVEFVARLDHLIQAVDKLSKMAKFKHDPL